MDFDELWDYFAPKVTLWNVTELSTSALVFLVSQLRAATPDEFPLSHQETALTLLALAREKLCPK